MRSSRQSYVEAAMRTMNLNSVIDSPICARALLAVSLVIVFAAVFGLFGY